MDLSAIVDSLRTDTVAAVRDSATSLKVQFAEAFKAAVVVDDSPDTGPEREAGWAALGDRIDALTVQSTAARQAAFLAFAPDEATNAMHTLSRTVTEQLQGLLHGSAEAVEASDTERLDETLVRLLAALRGGEGIEGASASATIGSAASGSEENATVDPDDPNPEAPRGPFDARMKLIAGRLPVLQRSSVLRRPLVLKGPLWRFLPQPRPYSRREIWEAHDEPHTH
jgi:hypothetical protein